MKRARAKALISVSDKTGIVELAKCFDNSGIDIVSTGGTAETLKQSGLPVTLVSDITNFPEILDGRVKTLHPRIFGGLLADPEKPEHLNQVIENNITVFQYVVVNLYPFEQTVRMNPENTSLIIENIDIGGPCLIRAAAKNHKSVLVVSSPADYPIVISALRNRHDFSLHQRRIFAASAYAHTSRYDYIISKWMNLPTRKVSTHLPNRLHVYLEKTKELRYGENPHQAAAVYRCPISDSSGLLSYIQHSGKDLSFNNLLDTQAAWNMVVAFRNPAAIVVKHQNPCGAAESSTLDRAFGKALECDPMAAFGGIVALNRSVDTRTAKSLHKAPFLEVIAAPGFEMASIDILKRKKNRRLIQLDTPEFNAFPYELRMTNNGAIVQTTDASEEIMADFKVVTSHEPSEMEWVDLIFGWNIVRYVKSNAIVCAKDTTAVGVGAGQMSRVDSVEIALKKAGARSVDSILASDAFFPFRDSIDLAAEAGVKAVIQPGGSKGDSDVINACDAHGIAMVFTGIRHFKH
jgi:phosphoribosylaminoimidazolecarboxamide formyltransferase / IMP cyclohydrolase